MTPPSTQHWYQDFQVWVNVVAVLSFMLAVGQLVHTWWSSHLKLMVRVLDVPGPMSINLFLMIDHKQGRPVRPEKIVLTLTQTNGAESELVLFQQVQGYGGGPRLEPGDFLPVLMNEYERAWQSVGVVDMDIDFARVRVISGGQLLHEQSISSELRNSNLFVKWAQSKLAGGPTQAAGHP